MASANEELLDASVRHQILLLRFTAREARRAAQLLAASEEELAALLRGRLTEASEARLASLLVEVRRLREQAVLLVADGMRSFMPELAVSEASWEASALQAASPVQLQLAAVSVATLRAAVTTRPINGVPLEGWLGQLLDNDVRRVEQQLRLGIVQGETSDQIVRRIRGTRALGYSDGVLSITRRNAETLVRTAANHVSTTARQMTWEANSDIIRGVRWVATLDGRTSPVCQSRDGEVYPIDKGPRPPAHPNCRSTVAPVLDGERIVGERPSVTDVRTRAKREVDFRAEAQRDAGDRWRGMSRAQRDAAVRERRARWTRENITQVDGSTTYQQWLKRQSASFQDDVLGPTRGRLFREGLELDRFVDDSGRQYTLDQLRSRLDDDMRGLLDRLQGD